MQYFLFSIFLKTLYMYYFKYIICLHTDVTNLSLKGTEKLTRDAHQVSQGAFLLLCSALITQTPRGFCRSLLHIISFSTLPGKCPALTLVITVGQLLAQHQTANCCARDCSHASWSFVCTLLFSPGNGNQPRTMKSHSESKSGRLIQ